LSELAILLTFYVLIYLPLTGYLYGRQRRWYGMLGWDLLVLGLLLAFGGAGDAFAWAGLLWAFVAATGVLMLVIDVAELRSRRKRDR
jgi:hypothetical protein